MIPLPIPPEAAVEPAQPKLFQSSFLPLDSPPPNFPPLDEQAARQALRWIPAGCPIYAQSHLSAHLIFGPWNSPQYGFFFSIGH